jgi:hypothetical protein
MFWPWWASLVVLVSLILAVVVPLALIYLSIRYRSRRLG